MNSIKPILKINKDIYKKISELCYIIPDVEWSGILLYDVKGSIKDPESFEMIVKDIIPMNKGTKSYTEFDFNQNGKDLHIDYCMEHPEAMKWRIGLIHSHNTFSVFFSGTDLEELKDGSDTHNYYLSLIVNNNMDMEAKVGFKKSASVSVEFEWTALDEVGEEYEVNREVIDINRDEYVSYNCNIVIDKPKETHQDFFKRALTTILTRKPEPKELKTTFSGFMGGQSSPRFYNPYKPVRKVVKKDTTREVPYYLKAEEFVESIIVHHESTYRFSRYNIFEQADKDRYVLNKISEMSRRDFIDFLAKQNVSSPKIVNEDLIKDSLYYIEEFLKDNENKYIRLAESLIELYDKLFD